MTERQFWVLVEVWNKGYEKISHAYGKITRSAMDALNESYKSGTEYDRFNMCVYDTIQNYKAAIRYRRSKGLRVIERNRKYINLQRKSD